LLRNEPLAGHTSFHIGGPADFYIKPPCDVFIEEAAEILKKNRTEKTALFILGLGSNILVSDQGFRGTILDVSEWKGCVIKAKPDDAGKENGKDGQFGAQSGALYEICCRSGTKSDEAARFALEHSLCGLEFLAGLPGTIGGAVWMNARCYEKSLSDILSSVEILDESGNKVIVPYRNEDYDYKKSPFQNRDILILSASFRVKKGNAYEISQQMETYRKDRESKGHFSYPSAGSVFKNNRTFGKPTGKIIEELGLRGTQIGGARLADWHGNFIINTGGASAHDVLSLITLIKDRVRLNLGIELEPEILFVGF
jgi:UDP-N-acetylmuramate dehydrogenase